MIVCSFRGGADPPQQAGKQLVARMNAELAENRAQVRANRMGTAKKFFGNLIRVGKATAHPEHDIELGLRKGRKIVRRRPREPDGAVWSRAVADGFVVGAWKGASA